MIRLTMLTIEEAEKVPDSYCREHFPVRFERAGRYRFREDQLRCIGAGLLLDRVLGIRETDLAAGPCGKLYVPGSTHGFSLSHSGDRIVLADGEGNIGVDIEVHHPGHLSLAKRVYTAEEAEWMQKDPEERFFRLWSMKESVMKALGRGLSLPPESFSVLAAVDGKTVTVEGTELFLRTVPMEGYGLAVCSDRPVEEIRIGRCDTDLTDRKT